MTQHAKGCEANITPITKWSKMCNH